MARQNINTGSNANDGSGDTLRAAGTKINANFEELYNTVGGSDGFFGNVSFGDNQIIIEGSSDDEFETAIGVVNPTKDNTITFPDSSGEVILDYAAQELHNKELHETTIFGDIKLCDTSGSGHYLITYVGTPTGVLNVNFPLLSDSDTLTFNNQTQTLSNKTLAAPLITDPRIDSDIYDALGNKALGIKPQAAAVNYLRISGAVASGRPSIEAVGDDTNIDIDLKPKGAGVINISAPLRYTDSDYTVDGEVKTERPVALLNDTAPLTMTMGDGFSSQVIYFVNINSAAATVTPTTFAQGTSFTLAPGAAIQGIYNSETANSATTGWYLIGLDSDGGLGSQVIVTA
jgi:hypothetical protein